MAILHVAIYDAVNGVAKTHDPYFVTWRAERRHPPAAHLFHSLRTGSDAWQLSFAEEECLFGSGCRRRLARIC